MMCMFSFIHHSSLLHFDQMKRFNAIFKLLQSTYISIASYIHSMWIADAFFSNAIATHRFRLYCIIFSEFRFVVQFSSICYVQIEWNFDVLVIIHFFVQFLNLCLVYIDKLYECGRRLYVFARINVIFYGVENCCLLLWRKNHNKASENMKHSWCRQNFNIVKARLIELSQRNPLENQCSTATRCNQAVCVYLRSGSSLWDTMLLHSPRPSIRMIFTLWICICNASFAYQSNEARPRHQRRSLFFRWNSFWYGCHFSIQSSPVARLSL